MLQKINIHIQNKVVLQHTCLREFYQQPTLTQEGSDTTVQTIDLHLLAATNNLLGERGVAVVIVLTIRLYLMGHCEL